MATRRAVNDENLITRGEAQLGALKKNALATTTATTTTTTTRRAALGDLVANRARGLAETRKPNATSIDKSTVTAAAVGLKNVKPRVDTHWANEPIRRTTTRTNSIIRTSGTAASISSILTTGPKLVKAKTSETATVKEVKVVKKEPALKRSDSALTRRKAAIPAAITTTTTAAHALKSTSTESIVSALTRSKVSSRSAESLTTDEPISRFPSYSRQLVVDFDENQIDVGDDNNPLLCSEYANDIYSYLFKMQDFYSIRKNHLDGQREIVPRMRLVLMDWISEVHLQYHFTQETFHSTISIIDRYLQRVKSTARKNLQLVGVAAMFLASKYEELYPPEVNEFVYITDNTYSKEQILQMEKHIFKCLEYQVNAPTSILFLRRFSKAANADSATHSMAKYFIESASIDYNLSEYLPSEIAAASLFLSLSLQAMAETNERPIDIQSMWDKTIIFYTTYEQKDLSHIVTDLINYVKVAPTTKTNNVFNKYRNSKFNSVAATVQKSDQALGEILEFLS